MAKNCKYGCGTKIEWDTNVGKFVEVDGEKLIHSYKRCAKVLKDKGLEVPFDENYKRSS